MNEKPDYVFEPCFLAMQAGDPVMKSADTPWLRGTSNPLTCLDLGYMLSFGPYPKVLCASLIPDLLPIRHKCIIEPFV